MDFEQFTAQLIEDMKVARPDIDFSVREVSKLQGESYTGITLTPEGSNVGASINVEPLFAKLQAGAEYSDVAFEFAGAFQQALEQMPQIHAADLLDYDQMKDKLVLQVISAKENAEMLQTVPHQELDDLAVVCRFQLENTEQGSASILVTDQVLQSLHISREQLMQDALAVAPENNPARLRNMSEVMAELTGGMFDMPPSPMWVASVESGMNGAGVMAYPGFMDQAAEQFGGDFFVLPSSIHEVLFIPDDGTMNAEELSEMVASINETEVAPGDRLADVAFHYDADEHIFEKASAFEERMAAREEMAAEQPETITVLMVNPGERPYEMQVGTELEDLQAVVGGSIEVAYPFEDNVGLIMNEEGKLEGLPLNRALRDDQGEVYDIVAGPFMVVGLTEDSFGSLSKEQLSKFSDMFQQPEGFIKMGKSIMAFPVPEETADKKPKEAAHAAEKAEKAAKPKHKKPEHDGH